MSFAKLLEMVKDIEGASSLVKELEASSETLTKEVNRLEIVSRESTDQRNKYKSLIKSTLGVDEISEDALKSVIGNSKGDDKSKAEIENLQKQLADVAKSKQDLEGTYKQKIQTMNLEREISALGIEDEVIPTKLDYLHFRVKNGLAFNEDGQPIFINEDGSTKYVNGKPMTLKDRYTEILDKEPDLFKAGTKQGGGSSHTPGSGKSLADMSESEKVALYRSNPDAYRKLAAQS